MGEDRKFSREEITTLVAGPVCSANDGDNDEDEDWEEEDDEEEEKKGKEEEEPIWTAPARHGR